MVVVGREGSDDSINCHRAMAINATNTQCPTPCCPLHQISWPGGEPPPPPSNFMLNWASMWGWSGVQGLTHYMALDPAFWVWSHELALESCARLDSVCGSRAIMQSWTWHMALKPACGVISAMQPQCQRAGSGLVWPQPQRHQTSGTYLYCSIRSFILLEAFQK